MVYNSASATRELKSIRELPALVIRNFQNPIMEILSSCCWSYRRESMDMSHTDELIIHPSKDASTQVRVETDAYKSGKPQ